MANNDSKFYDGQICSVQPIESRFNTPQAFELAFEVGIFDDNHQPLKKVDVYLEISMRYGTGNNAQKTQKDMTFETLTTAQCSKNLCQGRTHSLWS